MTPCIEDWNEGRYGNGRPRKGMGSGRSMSGSRWVYLEVNGVTAESIAGLVVRHSCDNGMCVNPDHLVIGTYLDNARDAIERKRHTTGEIHGMHKLTESQVRDIRTRYRRPRGGRGNLGGNAKEIQAEFGISQACLSDIILRNTWANVAN